MRGASGTWAIVLSGGEGRPLRPLVQRILGQDRPPQYAPLLGPRSLLRQTLERLAPAISTERTVVATVRSHTAYIAEEFQGCAAPPYVLVQPEDRGTAAGALYPAHWIGSRDPEATAVIVPSDHFVIGDATLMAQVLDAVRALDRQPGRIVLLGAPATAPEGEDGWIEPGAALEGGLTTVRRLWTRPPDAPAVPVLGAGGRFNTAIVVARVAALIRLGEIARPELHARLARIGRFAGSDDEPAAVYQAYTLMTPASLFRDVLARHPEHLAMWPLERVVWSGLGSPEQVADALAGLRGRPGWAPPVDPSAIAV